MYRFDFPRVFSAMLILALVAAIIYFLVKKANK